MSATAPRPLTPRLAVFVALAGFAAAHWLTLVSDPPTARAALAVAAIAAGACLLALIERFGSGGWRRAALAAATVLASTAIALLAIGLPGSMLLPSGWEELSAGIDRGLAGLGGEVEFPYAGGEQWSRLILLAGLVCLLALGAALAFWPRRAAGTGARVAGLVILVAVYATAAAMRSGPEPLLAGLALLLLVAAWLWLPGLGGRTAIVAAALVAVLGALALPLAAAFEGRPWLDYRDWKLAVVEDPTESYNWDHSYGPLAPRVGTPLLAVRSDAPRYWRAAVLDSFDGYRWERSVDDDLPLLETPTQVEAGTPGASGYLNRDWMVRTEFEVRELSSEFAIAPGATLEADGVELDATSSGTIRVEGGALGDGDTYTTLSYAPNPSAEEMRRAPDRYRPALARHTTVGLPRREVTGEDPAIHYRPPVIVPLRGGSASTGGAERAARRLAGSPYGGVYRMARRATAGAATTYDAVKAIEVHLQSSYSYVETVPPEQLPLRAFLFEQRAGYCQQFSGTMALMLRMLGIPARVATGFSPGTRDSDRLDRFQVRDSDAHSWVEVYFSGIGWVPFDPTPAAAPAQLQTGGTAAVSAAGGGTLDESGPGRRPDPAGVKPAAGSASSLSLPLLPLAIALALPLVAGVALTVVRMVRHRSLSAAAAAETRARELGSALERLGWRLPPGITLRGIETRLRTSRRPAAAAYAAKLSAIRFAVGERPLPSLRERRRVRRELRREPGSGGRLAAYMAIPLGAPRRQGG
jgi:transglutaminase-like putative cysteine protease